MARPRWNKVITDLWGNKTRSLLVIASVTVGLFAVGLITSMHAIITDDMQTGYSSVNPANIIIQTTPFDQDLVDRVRHINGVRQAEGVTTLTLRVRSANGELKPIDLKAIPDIDRMQIDLLRLEQGVWPPNDREIVVDSYKLSDLPGGLGSTVEVELPSGKLRQLRLVGVVNDQTIGSSGGGGFFLAPVTGYITSGTLEWLETPDVRNVLYVTVDGDANDLGHLRTVANEVTKAMEASDHIVYGTTIRALDDHPNAVYVKAIAAVLYVLGFLVVFLSGFLITNTLSALLNQQVHQIGVMKTIGARHRQIMGIYMLQIFFFGMIAFVIAQPLASRAAYYLLEFFAGAVNVVLQGYRNVPLAMLLELVIALVVPQAAGFIPLYNGTRISTVEALSGYNQAHPPSGHSWVDRGLKNIRGIQRPLLLSLRNTFRRKGRLVLTLFTLTMGGAIFIATFSAQRSLALYIEHIGRYFKADVNLSLRGTSRIAEIQETLRSVPGVGSVEGWAATAGKLILPNGTEGETIELVAPPAGSKLVEPTLLEGRWVAPGDENALVVNERFREAFPDLKVNDILHVKVGNKILDMVVVGFFQLAGRSSGYVGYTTYEYLSRQTHTFNRASTFRVTADHPNLTLAEQEDLGRRVEASLEARGFTVSEVEAGHSLTASTANGLNILTGFLLIMAMLTAVVGSIGLTGTMSMNVMERTREIGILRAIGASDREVINLVMSEGVLIGIMSWIFGVLFSLPISSVLSNAINYSLFGASAEFTFTYTGVLLWLVIVVILSVIASVLPANSAVRLTIREVLAYE